MAWRNGRPSFMRSYFTFFRRWRNANFRAEMPGPSKDRLTPRITTTAKLLWGVYLVLTIFQILALYFIGKMGLFDSICHTFSTIATGGFSTKNWKYWVL